MRRLERLSGHLVVALVVLVVIGGATRVMEAGLACPDWPLCYGTLLPGRQMNLQVFLEWFHRLDAFVVGIALLVLAAVSVFARRRLPPWLPPLCLAALLLVAVQGGLGALTVIQLLPAALVTAHLATALLLVALVSGMHQGLRVTAAALPGAQQAAPQARGLAVAAMVVGLMVFTQCLLGGAMASQWAADRCVGLGEACRWLLFHRRMAQVSALAVLLLAGTVLLRSRGWGIRWLGITAGALVLAQVGLGVSTLRLGLAVPALTIGHQLVAVLLVAVIAAVVGHGLAMTAPGPMSADASFAEVIHG
ncbi:MULTISPECIES: COX15/CtaA family protein [Aphanothece]|uniref:COX15/CtaA family protein n=1 Tax=Aphanothece TaxID=1121 RepID=UPI00398EC4D4